jgi:hypothetical protein
LHIEKMDTDKSNSQSQSERDKINEQLDELRKKQQERNAKKKPRSRWGRLLGFWGAISGLFLFGNTVCGPPVINCYSPAPEPAKDVINDLEAEAPLEEIEQDSEKGKREAPINNADSNK